MSALIIAMVMLMTMSSVSSFSSIVNAPASCALNTTAGYQNRLPSTSYPISYSIRLQLFPVNATISGGIGIDVNVTRSTSCLVLGSAFLQVLQATFRLPSGQELAVNGIFYDNNNQFVALDFGQILPFGSGTLTIGYIGKVNINSASGFFASAGDFIPSVDALTNRESTYRRARPSPWTGMVGASRRDLNESVSVKMLNAVADAPLMYATQFEPMFARMAYPCYDEPSLKAYWQATFIVLSNYTVLFNTPQSQDSPAPSYASNKGSSATWKEVKFDRTPVPMTSYTVAFAMGAFDFIEGTGPHGLPVRVYTPPGKASWGQFALKVTIEAVAYFEKIYKIQYPMPKLDTIAVPAIVQDAMENWGLVTYDPAFSLVDPTIQPPPLDAVQIIAQVVCHETAHHWHGNMITCPWWDQMYTNEGFARWLQYTCNKEVIPEWDFFNAGGPSNYYSFVYRNARGSDVYGDQFPMYHTPSLYGEGMVDIMNSVHFSYPKGASANRQMNTYLGEDLWNSVLSFHLGRHRYTNPGVFDLATSFTLATPQGYAPVSPNTWVAQSGTLDVGAKFLTLLTQTSLPIVQITYDPATGNLNATQEAASTSFANATNTLYWVAVNVSITTPSQQLYVFLDFTTRTIQVPLNLVGVQSADDVQIRANLNSSSYAFFDYSDNQWAARLSELPSMGAMEQSVLVQNAILLVAAGRRPIAFANQIAQSLVGLQSVLSWNLFLKSLPAIYSATALIQPDFSKITSSLSQLVNQMGGFVSPSNDPYASIRTTALLQAITMGDAQTTNAGVIYYRNSQIANIPAALVAPACFAAAKSGSQDDRDRLIKYIQQTNNADALVGITGRTDDCAQLIFLVQSFVASSPAAALNAFGSIISRNMVCRDTAWKTMLGLRQLITSDATSYLGAVIPWLSTPEEVIMISRTLTPYRPQYITDAQLTAAKIRLQDNAAVLNRNY